MNWEKEFDKEFAFFDSLGKGWRITPQLKSFIRKVVKDAEEQEREEVRQIIKLITDNFQPSLLADTELLQNAEKVGYNNAIIKFLTQLINKEK